MNKKVFFNPGLSILPVEKPMGFFYGEDVFGPEVEYRRLDDIRESLMDPGCEGPEIVYAIAMDVGKCKHKALLEKKHLLYGVVTYAAGKLGREPVRSQGHIHKVSEYSGWSTPEIYEIWSGEAIIYMQEYAEDNPGRCFAVYAKPGDVVIVPPYWVHATISADPETPLTFGAWCDRNYGFCYDKVREHKGIAWFPVFNEENKIAWLPNPDYGASELISKRPDNYGPFGIRKGTPIYELFEEDPDIFLYVPCPQLKEELWTEFIP
ncbi:MAG: glucose-6-phosphate isomerase [Tannerella sp.]|jgi:glucose-6-phosphate isomerase|nr:glucose-6-phosphate isomerase [Tannerella sp.]